MTTSEEMANVALWMMIAGGAVGAFGIGSIFMSAGSGDRGGLAKPMAIVGVCIFLLGMWLNHRWGSYW